MSKRSSKWIEGLKPEGSAVKAARKTLRRRLRGVWQNLEPAAERAAENPEYVHQLRVSTRRAMAAMAGYAELLPRNKAAWMEKQLQRIRRRAGAARDFDVLKERLSGREDAAHLAPLLRKLGELRREAQAPIGKIYRKLRRRKFPARVKKLLEKIHTPREHRDAAYQAWARLGMSRGLDAFFLAAAGDLSDLPTLHQFRIEGKHLRYAIEYFAGAFEPELREVLYPEIERMQGLLGLVNDHASAIEHYEHWRAEFDDAELTTLLDELLAAERPALAAAQQEFFRWWTPQRAADLKRRFREVLHLPACEEVA